MKLAETVEEKPADLLDFGEYKGEDSRDPEFEYEAAEKPKRGRPPKPKLDKQLTELFTLIGVGVTAVNEYDGRIIIKRSPKLAQSLNELAKENDAVREALESLLTVSVWSGVIAAAASIAVPIAANHKLMPHQAAVIMQAPDPIAFKRAKEQERAEANLADLQARERGENAA